MKTLTLKVTDKFADALEGAIRIRVMVNCDLENCKPSDSIDKLVNTDHLFHLAMLVSYGLRKGCEEIEVVETTSQPLGISG